MTRPRCTDITHLSPGTGGPGARSPVGAPRRQPLAFILRAALVLLIACKPASMPPAEPPSPEAVAARPVTVIIVRHAEKADDDPRDPSLSVAGEARARALVALLVETGVTHLFASEFRRTQATLGPLAAAVGKQPVIIPAGEQSRLVAEISALPAGSVVVVAGHSNTVPALVSALGGAARGTVAGPSGPSLPDDAYDRVFVVIRPARGEAQTLELRQDAAP